MADAERPLRVALVNDFPVVVAGLATLLEEHRARIEIEAYVGTLPEPGWADVVLLDAFGRPEPLTRLGEVARATDAPVLLFTWATSRDQVDAALEAGAAGFLSKTQEADAIVSAIEATTSGRPPRPEPDPGEESMQAWPGQEEDLSPRESEILCLIVAGRTNQEIAQDLYLSINSIKTYIRSAYRKMGVRDRSNAILWGIQHGFQLPREGQAVQHPTRSSADG